MRGDNSKPWFNVVSAARVRPKLNSNSATRIQTAPKRGDFSAAELRDGGDFYFVAADNRSGKDAVSRLRVIRADGEHFVLETENVTALRWTIFTYAAPGSFQTWYFLDREAGGGWRFYSLTRVLYANTVLGGIIPTDSYINRSVAMYRHFLGVPTDQGPPAAP